MAAGGKKKREPARSAGPKPRQNTPLFFLLAALLLLFGGYYDWTALLAGAVLALLLAAATWRAGGLVLPKGPEVWLLGGVALCSLVTVPFALSPGMALIGALRWVAALLLLLYTATFTGTERAIILDSVARLGAVMAAISIVGFCYTLLSGGEDANGRIDGFFEYANTYALFLLVCLVLLLLKENRHWSDWPAMGVLLVGVFLSGSRGVWLLLVGVGVFLALRQLTVKGKPMPVLLGVGAVVLLGGLAAALSGGLVLDRLAAMTLESSSLNGRLLYYLDGLTILIDHPLGVGAGGYLYVQPLVQTGPYILKSIHNEYLQAALDGSVLAGALLLALAAVLIFRRGTPLRQRLAVILLAAHACIDFDFRFFGVLALLLVCGCPRESRTIPLPRRALAAAGGVLAAVLGFFTVPYTLSFLGNAGGAWALWPWDLSLAEERLQSCAGLEEAGGIADRILDITDTSMLAWDCKFAQAAAETDYETMAECRYRYLRLNPYRPEVYEEMTALLENACREDPAGLEIYQMLAEKTGALLEEVYERTSPLAYRIVDKPDFSFRPALLERLQRIETRE